MKQPLPLTLSRRKDAAAARLDCLWRARRSLLRSSRFTGLGHEAREFRNRQWEGLSYKVNLTTRKPCGFRSLKVLRIALFHTLGALPMPFVTHSFC